MKPRRFAMITTFYPPHNFGGDGIAIQRLARALVRRGHAVTVIHDSDAYALLRRGPLPPAVTNDEGVEVISLRSRLRAVSPLLTQQTGRPLAHGRRIARLLREREIDVTLFNNVSLVGGPGVLRLGRGVRLYEAHEHWLVCPTHVLWRHNREVCTGRQCLRCVLAYRRPPQLWRFTGLLERGLRHVDAFIAKSNFSRDMHRSFGFPRPMEVIPYFLPPREAAEPQPAAPGGRPYYLFVGRLEKIKGLDDVIPAFREHPEADLLIAGDGEYATTLQRLAAGAPNIRFLGRLNEQDLARVYAGARALIVPSVCYETFGIILIEAFRQGTPVLARRIGPFPEIVTTSGGGLLFDGPADLLAAMRTLETTPGLRDRFAQAGRAAFEQHWSEPAVVPRYLELIERIEAERQGNRAVHSERIPA